MNSLKAARKQDGFTLIELMVASGIFLVLSGAIFTLLNSSQMQFQAQSQIVSAFDEARLGMDQIVRDVSSAGFPSISNFSQTPNAAAYAMTPFAWDPGYLAAPPAPCTIGTAGGGTCATPGDFDLIVEGNVDGTGVNWIRYQLLPGTTTLLRGVVPKVAGADPATATTANGVMLPYILNVMNNSPQIPQIQAIPAYSRMFPGGNPVPVFQYTCDPVQPTGVPTPCIAPGANNSPQFVRDITITLIVMTQQPDPQTGQLRLVELNGRAHRINPLQ